MNKTVESMLIGSLLADSSQLPEVLRVLPEGKMFKNLLLGKVYDAITKQFIELGVCDIATLQHGTPEAVVRAALDCAEHNSTLDTMAHAKLIAEDHLRSTASKTLVELQSSLDGSTDVFDALSSSIAILERLRGTFGSDSVWNSTRAVNETFDWLDGISSGSLPDTLKWGFAEIDNLTGGMDFGDLVIVNAPEKSGKTVMMVQTIFENLRRGIACLLFSGEMKPHHILIRMALLETGISYIKMRQNQLSPIEWTRLKNKVKEYEKMPLYIRFGSFSILDIRADVERFVREKGVKLVAVDYIQRVMSVSSKSSDNREREVAAISSGLKSLAMDQNVVVMALSQVNADLRARESRAIEHDMDKMITIDVKVGESVQEIGLRQRMGKSGDVGTIRLHWDKERGCWRNAAKDFQEELQAVVPQQLRTPF